MSYQYYLYGIRDNHIAVFMNITLVQRITMHNIDTLKTYLKYVYKDEFYELCSFSEYKYVGDESKPINLEALSIVLNKNKSLNKMSKHEQIHRYLNNYRYMINCWTNKPGPKQRSILVICNKQVLLLENRAIFLTEIEKQLEALGLKYSLIYNELQQYDTTDITVNGLTIVLHVNI